MSYTPDCADCPTPSECKAKNDCQVMRELRHGHEKIPGASGWDNATRAAEKFPTLKATLMTDPKPDAAALLQTELDAANGAVNAEILSGNTAKENFARGEVVGLRKAIAILEESAAPPADSVSAELKMLPEDLATHRNDWRAACEIAKKHAHTEADSSYWAHQLSTLARVEAILLAASKPSEVPHG